MSKSWFDFSSNIMSNANNYWKKPITVKISDLIYWKKIF